MKLKLTYKEIIALDAALNAVGNSKSNAKFSMKVAQNRYILKPFIENLNEVKEATPEMISVDKERRAIFDKYAVPSATGQMQVPTEKWTEFKAEIDEFKEVNKKVTDAYDAQLASYEALLKTQPEKDDKPVVMDMVEIPDSMLPKDLTGNQIEGIFPIVKMK